jgi:transcriptional regulator with XRE-family HTH domain
MADPLPSYLRTHRKKHGFSQDELAELLGCSHGTIVSRFEYMQRPPTFKIALACEIIFDVPAQEIFPGILRDVERETAAHAADLIAKVISDRDRATSAQKLQALRAILERVDGAK